MFKQTRLKTIVWLNVKAKSASMRLTKLTGKSDVRLHPKHLVTIKENLPWYLDSIEPGMHILDVGCGHGIHSGRAANKDTKIVALDYSLDNLQTAQALYKNNKNIQFMRGDLENSLPFPENAFDLVLMLDVIEHIYKRIPLLQEIRRVLRPQGVLLVSAPNRDTSWKRQLRAADLPYVTDPDHKIEYTLSEFNQELYEGGFEPQSEAMTIVYDTPWAGFIDLTGGISLAVYKRLARWKVLAARRHPEETIGWRMVCQPVQE